MPRQLPLPRAVKATQQCPLGAVACYSRFLVTCGLLVTPSHFRRYNTPAFKDSTAIDKLYYADISGMDYQIGRSKSMY